MVIFMKLLQKFFQMDRKQSIDIDYKEDLELAKIVSEDFFKKLDMGIAVVLNLDDKLLKKVYNAQEILLNELEIKHQIINQSHPHINIFSGDIKILFWMSLLTL